MPVVLAMVSDDDVFTIQGSDGQRLVNWAAELNLGQFNSLNDEGGRYVEDASNHNCRRLDSSAPSVMLPFDDGHDPAAVTLRAWANQQLANAPLCQVAGGYPQESSAVAS